MRQLLRASQERQAAAASAAADARARLLARLQLARRRQQAREEAALSHGTERWQQQQVVLHEADLARRDAAASSAASQERQVARLWMKLQRHLTHPRAPWAPAPSAEAEMEAVFKLDKSENALRQRCRLRRVEGGTRHAEASISQKLAEVGRQAADADAEPPPPGSEAAAARPQPAAASGGSAIALLLLSELRKGAAQPQQRRAAIAAALGRGGGRLGRRLLGLRSEQSKGLARRGQALERGAGADGRAHGCVERGDDVVAVQHRGVVRAKVEAGRGAREWRVADGPQPLMRGASELAMMGELRLD